MNLNTNNKQLAFQYKPKTNEYVLETITDTMVLSTDNIRLKYYEGEDLFCVDVGYSIDGDISKMSFKIDDLIVYPVVLKTPDKLQQQVINNQAIYIISEDYNFKSIIFIPIAQLNKTFEYTITSYNSCISSFVIDQIGKKFNSDVIYAEATQVTQNNSVLGSNVQTALDILLKRYMIPPQIIQVSEADGTFDDNIAPANWYKNMYGVTTVWRVVFANEGIYLRTEGDLANVDRVNGIQGDAIRNITGTFEYGVQSLANQQELYTGALYQNVKFYPVAVTTAMSLYGGGGFNASLVVPTANENRVKNRLVRIYYLDSIEGIKIKGLINAIYNLQQRNK